MYYTGMFKKPKQCLERAYNNPVLLSASFPNHCLPPNKKLWLPELNELHYYSDLDPWFGCPGLKVDR